MVWDFISKQIEYYKYKFVHQWLYNQTQVYLIDCITLP